MHYKGEQEMKCPRCGGLGRTKATEFIGVDEGLRDVVILCPTCGGSGKVKQTNEEWFDALPTEGKAKWLDGLIAYCFGVGHRTETEQKKYQHIVADVEVWLKQPHREE